MIKQFRNKSAKELNELVRGWKSELLALRFQQAVGQLEKPHKFRELRVSVARALTVLAEMERNAPAGVEVKEKRPRLLKIRRAKDLNEPAKKRVKKAKAPASGTKTKGGEG